MSYIPPHLRSKQPMQPVKNQNKQSKQIQKLKDEFPVLAPVKPTTESKMDFKELFTRRKEIKRRLVKMKKGWIKLTHNGIVDSLTEEERTAETLYHKHFKMNCVLEKYTQDVENDIIKRIEYDGLEPEILEFSNSSEEEYESSEESYVDEDEEDDEL